MRKFNILLIIILVAQIGLIAFQYLPGKNDAGPVVELLPDLTADEVGSFTVEDSEGEKVRLTKDADGRWQVAGIEQTYPADAGKIDGILEKLTSLKSERLVTRTRASHVRLKVNEKIFAKKISLAGGKDKEEVLYLGSPVGGETLHARAGGSDRAYLVSGISAWELGTDAASWWRQDYLDLGAREITRLSLTNAQGSFTLVKNGDWELGQDGNSTGLASEQVNKFVERLKNLKIKDYLSEEDRDYGLNDPEAQLNLAYKGGKITVKAVPFEKEEHTYVVKSSASPYYVTMTSYSLEPLLEQQGADFKTR